MDKTSAETRPRIVSEDTHRANRVPPGQRETKKWPVLHYGSVPQMDTATHRFQTRGLVERPLDLSWDEFNALPTVEVFADFHCVTTWSKLDNTWTGVSFRHICELTGVKPDATHVIAHAAQGFTANLPLADAMEADVLVATHHNGAPLSLEHGWPMRLVVPKLYAWKSAKWLTGLEFLDRDQPGFWEGAGYHMHGDPWTEERFGGRS